MINLNTPIMNFLGRFVNFPFLSQSLVCIFRSLLCSVEEFELGSFCCIADLTLGIELMLLPCLSQLFG
jgi:hypothetical protein